MGKHLNHWVEKDTVYFYYIFLTMTLHLLGLKLKIFAKRYNIGMVTVIFYVELACPKHTCYLLGLRMIWDMSLDQVRL